MIKGLIGTNDAGADKIAEMLSERARDACEAISRQREEILSVFIAKFGFHPEKAEQVIKHNADGTTSWFVRMLDTSI